MHLYVLVCEKKRPASTLAVHEKIGKYQKTFIRKHLFEESRSVRSHEQDYRESPPTKVCTPPRFHTPLWGVWRLIWRKGPKSETHELPVLTSGASYPLHVSSDHTTKTLDRSRGCWRPRESR